MSDQHWQAFDRSWFDCHQDCLLGLLARPWIGRWLRWVLCIRASDVGYQKPIIALHPNSYTVENSDGTFTIEIRTHDKFAKRLYFALRAFWWLVHLWDWAIADRWLPQTSFGLAVLTDTPEVGDGTYTSDALLDRIGSVESFSTIRNGAGTGSVTPTGIYGRVLLLADITTDTYQQMGRTIQSYRAAVMGIGTITSAIISVRGESKLSNLGALNLHVAGATPANPAVLDPADYQQILRTSFGNVTYASYSTAAYNNITLNASGLATLTLTGIMSFSWQSDWDITNTPPTWSNNQSNIYWYSADQTGTSQDPKLAITYSAPETLRYTTAWKKRRAAFAVSNPGGYF